MNKLATLLAAGALVAGALQAEAVQIDGSIGFSGTFSKNGTTLLNTTTINILSAEVDTFSGDFGGFVSVDDAVAFATPLSVGTNGALPLPANPLWSVGGFQLDVTSFIQLFESSGQLGIAGTGIISGNGFDATPGDIQLNFTSSGASLTFSATSAAVPTPDGGATAMLLGLGVLGLAGVRRKLS